MDTQTDVATQMMMGYDHGLAPAMWESFLQTSRVGGTMHVITPYNTDEVLAVGLWFGPGRKMFAT